MDSRSDTVGNAAVMREALVGLARAVRAYINAYDDEIDRIMSKIVAICDCALSAPARNCDVYSTKDAALEACHGDRCFLKSPIDERESVISFMLSEYGPEAKRGEEPDMDEKGGKE